MTSLCKLCSHVARDPNAQVRKQLGQLRESLRKPLLEAKHRRVQAGRGAGELTDLASGLEGSLGLSHGAVDR